MYSIRMGMPSPGMFGMNFNGRGKEYRNYKIQPLKKPDEYTNMFYENEYNRSVPLSVLQAEGRLQRKRDEYDDPNKVGKGALIRANAAGVMKAGGAYIVDDDEEEFNRILMMKNKLMNQRKSVKNILGKGIAYNQNELRKLRTGGGVGSGNGSGYFENQLNRIRKGMVLPPGTYQKLLKARKGGNANVRKLLRPSRMSKYIGYDESTDRAYVKRGGSFWGLLASAVPGIIQGITKTVDYFKNRNNQNQGDTASNILDTVSNVASNFSGVNPKLGNVLDTVAKTTNAIKNTADTFKNMKKNNQMNFSGVMKGINQAANNFKGINANVDKALNGVSNVTNLLSGNNDTVKDTPTGTGHRRKKCRKLTKAEFLERMRLGKERARRLRGYGCGVLKRSKDENLIQESMECDNPIVSDESRNVKPYSFEEFKSKLLSYCNVPDSLIKPIYNYGYLNKPTSAVACAKADSVMKQLDELNDESFAYYDSYEEFEECIDEEQTTYNIIFHSHPSDPEHGHFEACIYNGPDDIEWYSSLGNQPALSEDFIESHEIEYSNIQHQKTTSNANGCFWYCLLYLCSESNILPC